MSADGLIFVFAGKELTLSPRVKHKYVRRAQNLMTEWMLKNIDMKTIMDTGDGGEASMSGILQTAILANPALASDIQELENSMLIDQTIMLASGLDHSVLVTLKNEAYEEDYINLYKKCVELLGGDANDFFGVYRTDLSSKQSKTKPKVSGKPQVKPTFPE